MKQLEPNEMRSFDILDSAPLKSFDFVLPPFLEASEPPEARGLERDEVRLMVSYLSTDRIFHSRFRSLDQFLKAGDTVVVNTSGTLNAALKGTRSNGTLLELHLSTCLPASLWIVELRQPAGNTTLPYYSGVAGEVLNLEGGGIATLQVPYLHNQALTGNLKNRLWIATLNLPVELHSYLERYGFPIRYSYVREDWPGSYYQTVYVTEMGSAEMPSAGRAFTANLITKLVAKGVIFAPLLLHTGVASLEDHEPPYEEYYKVPDETARLVNDAHKSKKRVVAVGTSVVRALESVTTPDRTTHPGEGWTALVISPERGINSVDGMLTGFHEPRASHLAMLEALAGGEHLKKSYAEALSQQYLWHEFGDLHLILP